MFRVLPTLTAFAAVLTAGLVPGLWAGRFGPTASLDEAAARLSGVPNVVGDWTGRDLEMSPREQQAVQANGVLYRRYLNSRTGGALTLMLLCGRPGPLAVHTPDVCYGGAGYEEVGTASRYEIPGAAGNWLKVRRFQKQAAAPVYLRVAYGWSAAGAWEAPDNPRLAFARSGVLYKLYVIRELARPDESLEGDPAGEFIRNLVPPLRAALFPDT